MTEEDLRQIEARCNRSSEGPWEYSSGPEAVDGPGGSQVAWEVPNVANGEFIAHARTDAPALIAEVRRLRAEIDAAKPESAEQQRERLGFAPRQECGAVPKD